MMCAHGDCPPADAGNCWTAHVIELQQAGRLIRPQSQYIGPRGKKFVPINER